MTLYRLLPVALLVAVAACDIKVNDGGISVDIAEGVARDEWTNTYTLEPGGELEIVNVNGSIQARPSSGNQVEVRARRQVRTGDEQRSRELLQKVEMIEETAPDRVKIEARTNWDPPSGGGRRPQLVIEYEVAVPSGLRVDLETENGGVILEGIGGTLRAATTNGGVTADGVSGSLSASTVNGGIQVGLRSVSGDVELATVNGGVRLELPADVRGVLDARAVNGGVSVDEGLRLDATERERLHVAGRLNGGGPRIAVQTTNGGVRIEARSGG